RIRSGDRPERRGIAVAVGGEDQDARAGRHVDLTERIEREAARIDELRVESGDHADRRRVLFRAGREFDDAPAERAAAVRDEDVARGIEPKTGRIVQLCLLAFDDAFWFRVAA